MVGGGEARRSIPHWQCRYLLLGDPRSWLELCDGGRILVDTSIKPMLDDETGRVLVDALEHVVVGVFGCNVWMPTCMQAA